MSDPTHLAPSAHTVARLTRGKKLNIMGPGHGRARVQNVGHLGPQTCDHVKRRVNCEPNYCYNRADVRHIGNLRGWAKLDTTSPIAYTAG